MQEEAAPAEVLYPPIDDDSSVSSTEDNNNYYDTTNHSSYEETSSPSGPPPHSSIPTTTTAAPRQSNTRTNNKVAMSQQLVNKFAALKKRKVEDEAVADAHIALAEETLGLAATEIARMQRACAELESRLLDSEQADYGEHPGHDDDGSVAVIPLALPKVVFVSSHHSSNSSNCEVEGGEEGDHGNTDGGDMDHEESGHDESNVSGSDYTETPSTSSVSSK